MRSIKKVAIPVYGLLFAVVCLFSPLQGTNVLHAQRIPAAEHAKTTLFEGARMIIGDGSPAIENSAFLVEDGRFTAIGKKGEISLPPGATRVDLTGKTVMPTMLDTHGHLGGTQEDYTDELNLLAFCGVAVTTSMGQDTLDVFAVRANQPLSGARILTSGRGMVGPLGQAAITIQQGRAGRLPEDERDHAVPVADANQARQHVRELAWQRADFIKIWVDSRLGLEIPMKPEVWKALIDEAHAHNLRVFAHLWTLQNAKDLVRNGLDALAHPVRSEDIDDEFIQLMKDRPNVYVQTNLSSTQWITLTEDPAWMKDPLFLDITSPEDIKKMEAELHDPTTRVHEGWPLDVPKVEFAKRTYGFITRNTKRLYAAGIPYAIGTDGGGPPRGFNNHAELERVVQDIGLTPSQAIKMATLDAARALEMDRHLGSMTSGKDASFIVLTANPLEDIANTRRISQVYLQGRMIDRDAFKADWQRKHHFSH